jgi:anthranilate/para-aminobenzoate synthase component I
LLLEVLTIGQGGIVFDSDPYDEWIETINKLGGFISLLKISPPGRTFD